MKTKFDRSIYLALVLIFCTLGLIPKARGEQDNNDAAAVIMAQENENEDEENESQLQGIPLEVNEIAQQITVRIDGNNGNGSGVIFARQVDKSKENKFVYYVLTAKHVVEKPQQYTVVTEDEESYPVSSDEIEKFADSDLAVVKFGSDAKYNTARFGDYQFGFNEEAWVFVYGWAKSSSSPQPQFSAGKIAGKETGIFLVKDDLSFAQDNGYELVYTNLSESGMSGGPVLDTSGRVIGIHASAEGERYKLANKLQLGFSLGVPVGTFLNSDYAQDLIVRQGVEIKTTKERLDIDPFTQPKLSQEDLESILYILKGEVLQNLSQPNEAIDAYDRAIASDASSIVLVRRGSLYRNLEQYDLALQDFDRATNSNPKYIDAYINRGLTYYQLGNYAQALNDFNHVISLDYLDPRGYLGRGLVNYQLEELNQSATDFYFAWQAYQQDRTAQTEVSNVSSQPDKYAQMTVDFGDLLQANATPGHLEFGKSVALALMGEQDKAIAHLQQASNFFQTQQDTSSYQLTQTLLEQVDRSQPQATGK